MTDIRTVSFAVADAHDRVQIWRDYLTSIPHARYHRICDGTIMEDQRCARRIRINLSWGVFIVESIHADRAISTEASSGVSWASILAGAFVAGALSLALFSLGAGLGLSSVSPWSGPAVSGSTFTNISGAYLLVVAVMSSSIGGYLASRLRTRWTDLHSNEVFFRDSAHGLVAWAFATVISATLLTSAITHLVGGTPAAGPTGTAVGGSQNANSNAVFIDRLFRTDRAPQAAGGADQTRPSDTADSPTPGTPANKEVSVAAAPANNNAAKAEVVRLWSSSFADGSGLQPADRNYVAHLIAQQTGMTDADAQKRVDDVANQTKDALERARQNAIKLSFWVTAALLFGAFTASLAAVEGGQHRDGTWNERKLVPRAW